MQSTHAQLYHKPYIAHSFPSWWYVYMCAYVVCIYILYELLNTWTYCILEQKIIQIIDCSKKQKKIFESFLTMLAVGLYGGQCLMFQNFGPD